LSLLGSYLLRRALGPTLVALALLCGLIFLLQALRLGHHLLGGGGAGLGLLARVSLLSLPTLVVFCLPLSLAAGLLFSLGRLEETGQLLALRAAGASPLRLAAPHALLGLAAALTCLLVAALWEPAALRGLRELLGRRAAEVLVASTRPGRFQRLAGGGTLFVRQRLPAPGPGARFGGFLLARDRPRSTVLVAREATLSHAGRTRIRLQLKNGELQLRTRRGGLRTVRFQSLQSQLDLGPALDRHLGFLARMAAERHRALTAPLSCLALALLATAVGLSRRRGRMQRALLGLAGVAGYQLSLWGVTLVLPGAAGAVLLAGLVAGGALLLLVRGS
jgi:lipopolysaccharide export system permease protein